jgi:hypothetical protein
MKKLINVTAILGVISMAALMTGCGGSDHNDDTPIVTPTPYAPASLTNQTVTLTEDGQSRDLQFATSGDTFTQFQTGTTNSVGNGNFQYTKQGDNAGQLVLTTTGDGGTANTVTYNLVFTSATSGTYTFTTSGGQSGSGTFSNLQTTTGGGSNGGGNDGGGNNGGGNNGGGTGEIPTSLTGRVIDFTASGQGNERLTFSSSGSTVTSDAINPPNNVGTYTFTAGTGGAPGALVVTFPNGDTYNLQMTFTDATHGTWAGSQRFDNADHPVPGGSSFTIQP